MRLLVAAVALTSLTALSVPSGAVGGAASARAAPQTCHGETATMVGSASAPTIVGTGGRDVIISNGSDVDARGGADTICVTGDSHLVAGGAGRDTIVFATVPAASLDGGPGNDTLTVLAHEEAAWVVDVPGHIISADTANGGETEEAVAEIIGLETFRLGRAAWTSLSFTGGDQRDVLDLTGDDSQLIERPLSVRLGDGDDALTLMPGQADASQYVYGGPGRDAITLIRRGKRALQSVFGSTRHHSYSINGTRDAIFLGFEKVAAENFSDITLQAGSGDNVLRGVGCQATLQDSSGDDVLRFVRSRHCRAADRDGFATIEAGYGDDLMVGSGSDDVLRGGSGSDVARGGDGTDLCVAEVQRSCELRSSDALR